MKRVKAITLWQPWASLVAIGAKQFETRSWATSYRGPLAIHAAQTFPREARALCLKEPFYGTLCKAELINPGWYRDFLPRGAVVVLCILEEIYFITDCDMKAPYYLDGMLKHKVMPLPPEPERSFGDYTPGRFAWKLPIITRLPEPIPAKGRLGLWEWEPPGELEAALGKEKPPG